MTDKMIELMHDVKADEVMYPIYVPSYMRAGTAPLLNLLAGAPSDIKRKVYIVCRASESKAYRRAYPWATIVEQRVPWGIGPARMVCLQDADKRGFERIVMMDDDIIYVSLLEDRSPADAPYTKSGRYSIRNSGMGPIEFTLRNLAFGCEMADAIFDLAGDVAYGSTRSAFMTHSENVSVAATIDKGGFPLCVLFIDVQRFTMRDMPPAFQYEGEDLAMFLDTYEQGWSAFLMNTLVFDDDRGLPTTIPFSGDGEIDRTANMKAAQYEYPGVLGPYLRVTYKNQETGAIKRIGINWREFHRMRGTHHTEILTGDVVSFIEEARS